MHMTLIITVSGSREEAEKIKQELEPFLTEKLNLMLSTEKNKNYLQFKKARFLEYDINVR